MEMTTALLRSPLFRGIDRAQLMDLLDCLGTSSRRYQKGETVFQQGDRTSRFGLVVSGMVHIVKEEFWGNRTIVGLARAGEVFAESYACLASEPLEVSVLAAADTEILFMDAARAATACSEACGAHGTLSRNLLSMLAGRNLSLTRKMGHMAHRSTREKLLSYLSAQAVAAGRPEFDIPLNRQQLADYLAVDRSAMSTVLGELRDQGVLTFRKNHFHLLREMDREPWGEA